jgi:hypothetical protein
MSAKELRRAVVIERSKKLKIAAAWFGGSCIYLVQVDTGEIVDMVSAPLWGDARAVRSRCKELVR